MKKILFGCIISLTVFSCNKKPDKDDAELRAQVMASCESTALSPEMSEEKEILVKEYCNLQADFTTLAGCSSRRGQDAFASSIRARARKAFWVLRRPVSVIPSS